MNRQVEFYFSDENLPSDAHLLMKTGGHENLPVSIKHICGFSRMRKYKPYRSVVESLKKSEFLNIIDDKFIQRKVPLALSPTVTPQQVEQKKAEVTPVQKVEYQPWETKGMVSCPTHTCFVTTNCAVSENRLGSKSMLPTLQSLQVNLRKRGNSMTGALMDAYNCHLQRILTACVAIYHSIRSSFS